MIALGKVSTNKAPRLSWMFVPVVSLAKASLYVEKQRITITLTESGTIKQPQRYPCIAVIF